MSPLIEVPIDDDDLYSPKKKSVKASQLMGMDDFDMDELAREYEKGGDWSYRAIIFSCLSAMAADINFTMIVAFLPSAARDRGLSPFEIGLLFSVFQLFNFITCFFMPAISRKFGGAKVLIFSNLSQAIFTLCLAFTGTLHDPRYFFAAVLCMRALQGIMAASAEIASGGIIMRSVPREVIGEALAIIETARMLGVIIGPIIGGALYQNIGYAAPFIFTSAIVLTVTLSMIFFPLDGKIDAKEDIKGSSAQKKLLKSPVIIILILSIIGVAAAVSFLEPTIEPFMSKEPYLLNHFEIGAVYSSFIVFWGITAAVAGPIPKYIGKIGALTLGNMIYGLAYYMLAPPTACVGPLSLAAFMHTTKQIPAVIQAVSSMALIGIGCGIGIVPINELMVCEGEFSGVSVEDTSDSIVTILNMSFTAGSAIGPFLGGTLVHQIGFPKSSSIFGVCNMVYAIVLAIVLGGIFSQRKKKAFGNNINDDSYSSNDPTYPLLLEDGRHPDPSR